MEDIHVQPKKSSIIPWILVLLVIAAVIWYFVARDDDDVVDDTVTTTEEVTPPVNTDADANADDWATINFVAPVLVYDEITDDDITVRGNEKYGIYAVGEDVFFASDKATIRPEAENKLKEIVSSINKHYENGPIRIYGYTDARGSAGYNMELAEDRVDAVVDWLTKNGIDAGRISRNAIGEVQAKPAGTNEEERQNSRRVEIVAQINNNNVAEK